MRAERKKTLMMGAGVVPLIAIALFIALFLFDINAYKSKIETAASETTGLDVRINGKLRLSLFPLGLLAKDIHFDNNGDEILSLEHLKLRAELLPLLRKQLKVIACELVKPAVTIIKDAEGKYNFETTEKKSSQEALVTPFSLNGLKLSRGPLSILTKRRVKRQS